MIVRSALASSKPIWLRLRSHRKLEIVPLQIKKILRMTQSQRSSMVQHPPPYLQATLLLIKLAILSKRMRVTKQNKRSLTMQTHNLQQMTQLILLQQLQIPLIHQPKIKTMMMQIQTIPLIRVLLLKLMIRMAQWTTPLSLSQNLSTMRLKWARTSFSVIR